jgi:deoxyribonuclease-4
MWRPTNHKPESIERFKERRAEAGIGGVVCHALYLCNLAAPDDEIHAKSIAALSATVDTAVAIEADAVIFHVGSHLGAGFEAGLERVVPALEEILPRCVGPTWLLMENSAGTGGTIGRSLEELVALMNALDKHPRLGICLDSCHLYASGYDVTDAAVVDQLAAQIDGEMGIDRLRALHINDSAMPFASNRDRHANILEGELGEGLGAFLAHPAFQELPAYLEVEGSGNGPDENELRKVRELHARWVKKRPPTPRATPSK